MPIFGRLNPLLHHGFLPSWRSSTKEHREPRVVYYYLVTLLTAGRFGAGFAVAKTPSQSDLPREGATTVSTVPTYVQSAAQRMAASMGDANPTGAWYVLSTRTDALNFAHMGSVPDNALVYFFVMYGNFIDRHAIVPPGTSDPTGSTVMFTMHKKTHEILDFGLSKQKLDLTQLGLVQAISF